MATDPMLSSSAYVEQRITAALRELRGAMLHAHAIGEITRDRIETAIAALDNGEQQQESALRWTLEIEIDPALVRDGFDPCAAIGERASELVDRGGGELSALGSIVDAWPPAACLVRVASSPSDETLASARRSIEVVAAYTVEITDPSDGYTAMACLLVLGDGCVVQLHASGSGDKIYPSMEALGAVARANGWNVGELVPDADSLAQWRNGYDPHGATVVGGIYATH